METKICTKCGKEKPKAQFHKYKLAKDGLNWHCKDCVNEYHRVWDKTEKGRNNHYRKERSLAKKRYLCSEKGKRKSKNSRLKHDYGITLDEHEKMYSKQNGRCLICERNIDYKDVVTNHDHKTNKVRGLLCSSCNIMLGWFENRKEKIMNYLSGSAT